MLLFLPVVSGWGSLPCTHCPPHIPTWFCLPRTCPAFIFVILNSQSPSFPSVFIIYFQVMAQALPPGALFRHSQTAEKEGQLLIVAGSINNGIHASLEISQWL